MKRQLGLAFLLLASPAPVGAQALLPIGVGTSAPRSVPGEILVQFRSGAGNLQRQNALARANAAIREHVRTSAMRDAGAPPLERVVVQGDVDAALRILRQDPDVRFAEPNFIVSHQVTSNDTYYANGGLWGTYGDDTPSPIGGAGTTNAFGTGAEKVWAQGRTGSRTVYVGVVDEGVDVSHPDLAANVWTNPFDPPDGIDNDGNGFVDDVHGWDFVNDDNSLYDGGTLDKHGTHVAGTIGAVGGNGTGVAGMNWNVTIIPCKILGAGGGSTSDAVRAYDYLTALKTRHGLDVVAINDSWGGSDYSQALADAVIRAARAGILTVAAAGNSTSDNDGSPFYPANLDTTRGTLTQSAAAYDAVISVAAIDRLGALASFSDFGATTVDLGAPGVSIWSTLPSAVYGSYSGTSMAAPHVTGAAALFASANPGALAPEIRDAILDSARATPSLAGRTVTGGRLDVSGFLGVATHDVGIDALGVPSTIQQGTSATLSVMVGNHGTTSETFTVGVIDEPSRTAIAGSVGPPQTVTLAAQDSTTLAFTWTVMRATIGSHVLRATAESVTGDTDPANDARLASSVVLGSGKSGSVSPASVLRR